MVADGTFVAILARKPRRNNEKAGKTKAPRQPKEKQRREPTEAEAETEMAGCEFEDEAIEWVVLKVEWDNTVDDMAVYYYDKTAVQASGIDVNELDDDSDEVERSSVAEVRKWIANTRQ
jgi:hypothetical protein